MLTPSTRYLYPFSSDVIRDAMYSLELRRRPRADDRCHLRDKTGSSFLPPRVNHLLASTNSLPNVGLIPPMPTLAVADALGSAASTSSRMFPFPVPVGEPLRGTISGSCPPDRSPVSPVHCPVPLGFQQYGHQQSLRFGIQHLLSLPTRYDAMLARYYVMCPCVCPSVCHKRISIEVAECIELSFGIEATPSLSYKRIRAYLK